MAFIIARHIVSQRIATHDKRIRMGFAKQWASIEHSDVEKIYKPTYILTSEVIYVLRYRNAGVSEFTLDLFP